MALTRRRLCGFSGNDSAKEKKNEGWGFMISVALSVTSCKTGLEDLKKPKLFGGKSPQKKVLETRIFYGEWLEESSLYPWRRILHGRELLEKGMVKRIGNGRTTRVCTENWTEDPTPRQPMYRPDTVVDLTLLVSDLLIPNTTFWDVQKVRQLIIDEDSEAILNMKPALHLEDMLVWGLTRDGTYSSQTGYKLIDSLRNSQASEHRSLSPPPIEKHLWSNIWKLKTSPKIKHFVWRALSGALAVATQLRSRGIPMDKVCGAGNKSICHTLFTCFSALEIWKNAGIRSHQLVSLKTLFS